jgi:hypothetical protein
VEIERSSRWSFRVLGAAFGLIAMVLPRLPGIRPTDTADGVTPVGPFSAGLADGNIVLMSALLIVSAAAMTLIRPLRAQEAAVIVGLAPAVWTVIVMMLHGGGGFWIIALAFALGYGGIMAVFGVVLGKAVAWLSPMKR